MANPYTYGSDGTLGQRWSSKQATTATRLNHTRLMCDHLKAALDEVMDTTLTNTWGTWQNPFILGGASGWYMWFDETYDCPREKVGSAPSNEQDGLERGGGVV